MMASSDETSSMLAQTEIHQSGPEHTVSSQLHAASTVKSMEPATELRRSTSVLWLWAFYASLTIFAWTTTCVLAFRPITTNSYGADVNLSGWGSSRQDRVQNLYVQNENWYRVSRVLRSIMNILTLPLTSAICASAAVVYCQKSSADASKLNLRKTMVLADARWLDPSLYWRLIGSRGWQKNGSVFLLIGIFLNVLGGIIGPLQEALVDSTNVKTPTYPREGPELFDLLSFADTDRTNPLRATVMARSAMQSAQADEPQAQYWQASNLSCIEPLTGLGESWECPSRMTFSRIGSLKPPFSPFLVPLPKNYNTGLLRQYAPRISISVNYENISQTELSTCQSRPNAFSVDYHKISNDTIGNSGWGLQACVPGSFKSPWAATRARQDFSETIFLNITILNSSDPNWLASYYAKATMNTTAGYFELPNNMNYSVSSEPLAQGPPDDPGSAWERQIPAYGFGAEGGKLHNREVVDEAVNQSWTDLGRNVRKTVNYGPLLMTALALFGPGSFLENHALQSSLLGATHSTQPNAKYPMSLENDPLWGQCMELSPLQGLLAVSGQGEKDATSCNVDAMRQDDVIGNFLRPFTQFDRSVRNASLMASALTAAGYLSVQALLASQSPLSSRLQIWTDPGADRVIPTVSTAAAAVISCLIAADLLALLATALYAARRPRWTEKLDAWAMVRVGAAVAEHVPLKVSRDSRAVAALDKLPGLMGAERAEGGRVARLSLGGAEALRPKRRYECYPDDDDTRKEKHRSFFRDP